jgi:cathepsin L
VPPDLSLQARVQGALSDTVSSAAEARTAGAKQAEIYVEGCDPKAAQFDWRDKGAVTPIKDQGNCGDCFIFAATAAFESSWYLQNKEVISVSEQQILDCVKAGNCKGGWHGKVLNFLRSNGITSAAKIPYVAQPRAACNLKDHPYTAVNWSYVDKNGAMASPAAIKQALCTHGPVVS